MTISATYLRGQLDYDANNGMFFRLDGARAGYVETHGYRRITLARKKYLEHRLAWLHYYGRHPVGEIDHINGDITDNRISNLREATRQQNRANTGVNKNSRLGVKGVTRARGKYRVRIFHNGNAIHVGYFKTLELAESAHIEAADRIQGEFSLDQSRPSGRARKRAMCPAVVRSFQGRAA